MLHVGLKIFRFQPQLAEDFDTGLFRRLWASEKD